MRWDIARRQLVTQLSTQGLSPGEIAVQFGVSEGALRGAMHRYGIREPLRGTCVFTTASGQKVRRQVKPRRPAKVSLAKVNLTE